jgi:hypothetical protein
MRTLVCREGVQDIHDYIIQAGALKWPDDPLPISYEAKWDEKLIGRADKLRREKNGWITADVEFFDDENAKYVATLLGKGFGLTVWANNITRVIEENKEATLIKSGDIRAIFATTGIPWAYEDTFGEKMRDL